MGERLDFDLTPTFLAACHAPANRIADELLRGTLVEGNISRILEGRPGLVVIHGVRPVDVPTFKATAEDLIGGTSDDAFPLNLVVRDWTAPDRLRPDQLERLLVEACTTRRGIIVLCGRRSSVPAVLVDIADAVLPVTGRRAVISDLVEEIAGFVPDEALVTKLSNLPLPYCNLLMRPGMTRERMWSVAGRLRRRVVDDVGRGRKAKRPGKDSLGQGAKTPDAASARPERLEDLPGMGEAQRWGLSLASDLADHRAGTLSWDDVEGGALLHGPPGTGKTMFARALAGSCGLPLHAHSVAAWQARGHLGDLLKAMRAAFDQARKAPCILFVDELDSVGSRDEPLGEHASYQRQVINGFLECLDGTVGRAGVVVVGATNNVSAIDAAILRPGRLGRLIEVRLPDLDGRIGILRHHLRADLAQADLARVADEMGEVSGAMLAQLVREARAAARRERRALTEADLRNAVPRGVLLTDEAFRRLCVHEAGHVIVGLELARTSGLVPTGATVRRRMRHGLEHRTDFRPIEGFDTTRGSVEAQVAVLLAGIAAEEVLLGTRGSGSGGTAEADLVRATQLAVVAERSLGLGEGLVSVLLGVLAGSTSSLDDPFLRRRVEAVLEGCLREARLVVERRRADVEAVAAKLAESSEIRLG